MRTRFAVAAAVLILMTCLCAPGNSAQNPGFLKFKRAMMPKVGQKVTVVGILNGQAKLGYRVETPDGGIYIYAREVSDWSTSKMSGLEKFFDRRVTVTGTLCYQREWLSKRKRWPVASIPEHFYFDVAEIEVIASPAPAKG